MKTYTVSVSCESKTESDCVLNAALQTRLQYREADKIFSNTLNKNIKKILLKKYKHELVTK